MPKKSKKSSLGTSGKKVFLEPITESRRDRKRRVLDAIALKRRHPELSLTAVAKRSGTTLKTIRRYAKPTLRIRSGRLDVAPTDRIVRELRFLDSKGQIEITVRNSRDASRVARYSNAVRRYVIFGDDSQLQKFKGKSIKIGGQSLEFVTDPVLLNRLARAGEISFLDIYSSVGGGS